MDDLTPREIVEQLDRYIIGQHAAKRAVAIALRNRYRRRSLPKDMQDDVVPKNILMIGPTGVGKTEIARRLALLARAPFVKVEATKFTEVGYVGRDVDSMVRDLVQASIRMVELEKLEDVKDEAEIRAIERLVHVLNPIKVEPDPAPNGQVPSWDPTSMHEALERMFGAGNVQANVVRQETPQASQSPAPVPPINEELARKKLEQEARVRDHLRRQIASGVRDNDIIEIDVEEASPTSFVQVLGPQGGDGGGNGGSDLGNILGSFMPKRRKKRKMTIAEAKETFAAEEARGLLDQDQINKEAIDRAEQTGIIFVDEMDKIAGRGGGGQSGPDVSREGVQRDLLPIIEGSTVQTKFGAVRTDYVLFIAAGAFHISKPSDLIPELQGRLPIRVELENLTQSDFERILVEPKNALVNQYVALMGTEGITVSFTTDAISEIARLSVTVNSQMENIGARRLHTVMERLLEDLSFTAPEVADPNITIDSAYVTLKLSDIVKNEDLSRYIL